MKRGSRHSSEHAEIALLLKDMRLEAGLSQLEVATHLGDRPQSYVSAVEVGQRGIDLVQVLELIRLYDVSLVDFAKRLQARLAAPETERRPPRRRRAS
ncbi:helix-turn-helix domain-containing protein [Xanthomonas sp. NCPPB 2632]|uniref:helix-turn-helix domain-containing protein n=1 Tax=Xanthomonas sp. NCPPB 2632 TaxID=3240912 RepID=UPI003513F4F8